MFLSLLWMLIVVREKSPQEEKQLQQRSGGWVQMVEEEKDESSGGGSPIPRSRATSSSSISEGGGAVQSQNMSFKNTRGRLSSSAGCASMHVPDDDEEDDGLPANRRAGLSVEVLPTTIEHATHARRGARGQSRLFLRRAMSRETFEAAASSIAGSNQRGGGALTGMPLSRDLPSTSTCTPIIGGRPRQLTPYPQPPSPASPPSASSPPSSRRMWGRATTIPPPSSGGVTTFASRLARVLRRRRRPNETTQRRRPVESRVEPRLHCHPLHHLASYQRGRKQ